MNLLVWSVVIIIFLYTIGFALELWKDQNKLGSIAVFILALFIIIAPFFSVLT